MSHVWGKLSTLTSQFSKQPKESIYTGKFTPEIAKSVFHFQNVFNTGLPENPTCIAHDPVQQIAAIGTAHGSVTIYGQDPLTFSFVSSFPNCSINSLFFLVNKGHILLVFDFSIELWDFRKSAPVLVDYKVYDTQITAATLSPAPNCRFLWISFNTGLINVLRIASESPTLTYPSDLTFSNTVYVLDIHDLPEIRIKAKGDPNAANLIKQMELCNSDDKFLLLLIDNYLFLIDIKLKKVQWRWYDPYLTSQGITLYKFFLSTKDEIFLQQNIPSDKIKFPNSEILVFKKTAQLHEWKLCTKKEEMTDNQKAIILSLSKSLREQLVIREQDDEKDIWTAGIEDRNFVVRKNMKKCKGPKWMQFVKTVKEIEKGKSWKYVEGCNVNIILKLKIETPSSSSSSSPSSSNSSPNPTDKNNNYFWPFCGGNKGEEKKEKEENFSDDEDDELQQTKDLLLILTSNEKEEIEEGVGSSLTFWDVSGKYIEKLQSINLGELLVANGKTATLTVHNSKIRYFEFDPLFGLLILENELGSLFFFKLVERGKYGEAKGFPDKKVVIERHARKKTIKLIKKDKIAENNPWVLIAEIHEVKIQHMLNSPTPITKREQHELDLQNRNRPKVKGCKIRGKYICIVYENSVVLINVYLGSFCELFLPRHPENETLVFYKFFMVHGPPLDRIYIFFVNQNKDSSTAGHVRGYELELHPNFNRPTLQKFNLHHDIGKCRFLQLVNAADGSPVEAKLPNKMPTGEIKYQFKFWEHSTDFVREKFSPERLGVEIEAVRASANGEGTSGRLELSQDEDYYEDYEDCDEGESSGTSSDNRPVPDLVISPPSRPPKKIRQRTKRISVDGASPHSSTATSPASSTSSPKSSTNSPSTNHPSEPIRKEGAVVSNNNNNNHNGKTKGTVKPRSLLNRVKKSTLRNPSSSSRSSSNRSSPSSSNRSSPYSSSRASSEMEGLDWPIYPASSPPVKRYLLICNQHNLFLVNLDLLEIVREFNFKELFTKFFKEQFSDADYDDEDDAEEINKTYGNDILFYNIFFFGGEYFLYLINDNYYGMVWKLLDLSLLKIDKIMQGDPGHFTNIRTLKNAEFSKSGRYAGFNARKNCFRRYAVVGQEDWRESEKEMSCVWVEGVKYHEKASIQQSLKKMKAFIGIEETNEAAENKIFGYFKAQQKKVRHTVSEVKNTMTENLQKLEERGERLNDLGDKSAQLEDSSKNFLDAVRDLKKNQQQKSNFFGF